MILYTSDGCTYEGMTEETVMALRAERSLLTRFVSKEVYDKFMALTRKN